MLAAGRRQHRLAGLDLLRLPGLETVDVEEEALRLEQVDLLQFRRIEPALRKGGHLHGRGSSGAIPAASKSAMSCSYSGFPVVSSFSPKNTLFAPAIMQRSCASSLICCLPAESLTIARGIRMRAVAIIRTISRVPRGRAPAC